VKLTVDLKKLVGALVGAGLVGTLVACVPLGYSAQAERAAERRDRLAGYGAVKVTDNGMRISASPFSYNTSRTTVRVVDDAGRAIQIARLYLRDDADCRDLKVGARVRLTCDWWGDVYGEVVDGVIRE
jgi:hypothetical protein